MRLILLSLLLKLARAASCLFLGSVFGLPNVVAASEGALDGIGREEKASALVMIMDKRLLIREVQARQVGDLSQRACEIQRQRRLVPASCFVFTNSEVVTAELVEECRRLAAKAVVLPTADSSVPEACRQALDSRRKDIKYARQPADFAQSADALR